MRKITAVGGAMCAAAMLLSAGTALATQPAPGASVDLGGDWSEYVLVSGHKVTFCHRTGSASNPYVLVTSDFKSVDDLSVSTTDHQHHLQVGNGVGPDIIPVSQDAKKDVVLDPLSLCAPPSPPV